MVWGCYAGMMSSERSPIVSGGGWHEDDAKWTWRDRLRVGAYVAIVPIALITWVFMDSAVGLTLGVGLFVLCGIVLATSVRIGQRPGHDPRNLY